MTKKTTNILITTLITVLMGGYLLYLVLPMLIIFTASVLYLLLGLAIVILSIYGLYRLVSYLNN